jgi:hypothetical protein
LYTEVQIKFRKNERLVEVEESIRINRSVHIILDFDESLPQETISAATVIIIVITAALMQNGVRIDKVEIEGVDADQMKVSFHGKPGNFIREYFFETAMLMKAIQKAGNDEEDLQNQLLREFENVSSNLQDST